MIHGIERKEGSGHIAVRIAPQGGKLCICVEDDGVGMEEEALRRLHRQLSETRDTASGSIGLHNISQRIQLLYGEPYGLEVESEPDRGTTVRLYLPLGEVG
jgi:two-component system, sensor histidine kinase YesM